MLVPALYAATRLAALLVLSCSTVRENIWRFNFWSGGDGLPDDDVRQYKRGEIGWSEVRSDAGALLDQSEVCADRARAAEGMLTWLFCSFQSAKLRFAYYLMLLFKELIGASGALVNALVNLINANNVWLKIAVVSLVLSALIIGTVRLLRQRCACCGTVGHYVARLVRALHMDRFTTKFASPVDPPNDDPSLKLDSPRGHIARKLESMPPMGFIFQSGQPPLEEGENSADGITRGATEEHAKTKKRVGFHEDAWVEPESLMGFERGEVAAEGTRYAGQLPTRRVSAPATTGGGTASTLPTPIIAPRPVGGGGCVRQVGFQPTVG